MPAFGQGDHPELVVIDQENRDLAGAEGLLEIYQLGAVLGKPGGELADVGLDDPDAGTVPGGETEGDLEGRALAQIIHVGLERQAAAGHLAALSR